ncbi:MAG: phosphoribosylanthranilate isomerase [Bacteroidia bacterium]
MKNLKIKICGMKDPLNIHEIAGLGPDYMGFIFYPPSVRFVGDDFDPRDLEDLPVSVIKTGVFVNQGLEEIRGAVKRYKLDMVQLHGTESPAYCSLLREDIPVMKAFGIDEQFDFNKLNVYSLSCDYFLFDTQTGGHGGSGKKFDWNLLSRYQGALPFFLSGGISLSDIPSLAGLTEQYPMLYGIDLNSRFETEPGKKDVAVLTQMFNTTKLNK